jgi:hypothetical protein
MNVENIGNCLMIGADGWFLGHPPSKYKKKKIKSIS